MSLNSHHTALYTLSQVLHLRIMTVFCVLDQLLPVHHKNIYPFLVGSYNQNVQLSIVYLLGLLTLFVHPFKLYTILYSARFHFAFNVISPIIAVLKLKSTQLNVHPPNVYHVFVGAVGLVAVDQYGIIWLSGV